MSAVSERSPSEIIGQGCDIYEKLRPELEAKYPDHDTYVAINVDLHGYVVGKSHMEVWTEYEKHFGSQPSYMRGIGFLDHA